MGDRVVDDPLIGKVLNGRFQIIAPLGIGGMGKVYKALQQPLDRLVALKVLNPRYDGSKDPGFERRFFLEASLTAKLRHPNTITVHDYGRTDDGIFYIAMEYLEGETLQQVLNRDGRIPWQRALFIVAQASRSLREAHRMGLVHRDLKPANIMLLNEGSSGDIVKVLDFGLVKNITLDGTSNPSEAELTQAGVLLGSPMYMAPEQTRSEADARTDIYALGCVLFMAMTGRAPFTGKESIEVIVKHLKEKPPDPRTLAPEIPTEISELILKCLEKDPADRFQSMDELIEHMRFATSGQGMSGIFLDPRTHTSQTPRIPTPGTTALPQVQAEALARTGELFANVKPKTTTFKKPNWGLWVGIIGLVSLGAAVGGVLAFRTLGPTGQMVPKPDSAATVPQAKPEPTTPASTDVTFIVSSEPNGALVRRSGTVIGTTPFSFSMKREGPEAAQAELVFELNGFETSSVVAQGREGTVDVRQPLHRKVQPKSTKHTSSAKPLPKKADKVETPDGYKEDPYR
jgi:serine/threonine-protein kinase